MAIMSWNALPQRLKQASNAWRSASAGVRKRPREAPPGATRLQRQQLHVRVRLLQLGPEAAHDVAKQPALQGGRRAHESPAPPRSCAAPQARRGRGVARCVWGACAGDAAGCGACGARGALWRGVVHSVHQLFLCVAVRDLQRLQRHRVHQRAALALAATDGAVEGEHAAVSAGRLARSGRGLARRERRSLPGNAWRLHSGWRLVEDEAPFDGGWRKARPTARLTLIPPRADERDFSP